MTVLLRNRRRDARVEAVISIIDDLLTEGHSQRAGIRGKLEVLKEAQDSADDKASEAD